MKSKKRSKLENKEILTAYLFLLPNIIGFLLFSFFPVVAAFIISFTSWRGVGEIKFNGFSNYIELFSHDTFRIALGNTFYFSIGQVPLMLAISLLIAILLNQKIKGLKIYRALYFMPYVSSMVAVSFIWMALLHPTYGPINLFLKSIGFTNPPSWLGDVKWAMPTVIIMSIWKSFGYFVVVYLAGLQTIPSHLYEAATLDGANAWQKFRNVTLPMLTPITFLNVIMATIGSFKVFDQVYIMTEGGPGRATTTIVQYIYQTAFQQFRMGYASASAVILFLIIFIITLFQYRGQKKWVNY